MKARELMTPSVVTVRQETSLAEVAQIMLDLRIGCVLVVDQRDLLRGIITETDFAAKGCGLPFSIQFVPQAIGQLMPREAVERIQEAARTTTAGEIMTTEVVTATEETPVGEVAAKMNRHDIKHIPIIRDGSPVGIISRHDLMRMLIGVGPLLGRSS
ncbi:MAG: CBS domain-containing protein [Planctomycetaceae bacterium]|nr:CBS domain-containing protein [Planctomycetaceae bacterium]MBV8315962.1 CBS domain-containing protein [Planctomycetaceae bacterium]MBV8384542.1 CBS domain-containing protein [Planctomycetaceae bacterium]MBV8556331.1 CBS domain-containing protein [Planctomycetaceae bacterium]MBV8609166.1 CBS domain-containing protein [Singulisphaera sp.]